MIIFTLFLLAASALAVPVQWDSNNIITSDIKKEETTITELSQPHGESLGSRIARGQVASLRQFPYQAGLLRATQGNRFFCGASIISPEWILTAAHCVDSLVPVTVVVGAIYINNEEEASQQRFVANQIIIHPQWNLATIRDDVALIKLPRKIQYNAYVQPIRLPTHSELSETFVNDQGTVSGWGLTDTSSTPSPVLRFINQPIISNAACRGTFSNVLPSNICTSGSGGRNVCNSDSGGPLVVHANGAPLQVGVVSFGSPGCGGSSPAVYARTSSYIAWISGVTGINFSE